MANINNNDFDCVKSHRFSDDSDDTIKSIETNETDDTLEDEVIKEENTYTDEVIKEEEENDSLENDSLEDEVIQEDEEVTEDKPKTNPLNLKSEVALRCYKSGKFTEEQLKFIEDFESDKNTLSLKNHMIMNSIRAGINGSEHLSPNMSLGQVCVIKKGINRDMDVSSFANKDLSTYQMYESYKGLKNGVNVNDLDGYCNSLSENDGRSLNNIKFTGLQKRQLRKAMQQGIDIRPFAQGGMNSAKMFLLRRAARKGVAVETFASPALTVFGTIRKIYKHKRAIKANPAAYNSKATRYRSNRNSNYNNGYHNNAIHTNPNSNYNNRYYENYGDENQMRRY